LTEARGRAYRFGKPKGKIMDKKKLIDLLNNDLAREYTAMMHYLQCSYTVRGFRRAMLKGWLRENATEEMGHAIAIADKIVSLGGTPSAKIPEVKGLMDPKAILKASLNYELEVVKAFTQRVRDAEDFGDLNLRLMLEEQLAESQSDAEEIRKMLEE
jgi:bacterioferritin